MIAKTAIKSAIVSTLDIFDYMDKNSVHANMEHIETTKEYLVHTIRNISCSERGRDILMNVTDPKGKKDRVIRLLNAIRYIPRGTRNFQLPASNRRKRKSVVDRENALLEEDAERERQQLSLCRESADALYYLSLHPDGKEMLLYSDSVMYNVVVDVSANGFEDTHVIYMKLALLYNLCDTLAACKHVSTVQGLNKSLIGRAMAAAQNETKVDDLCSAVLCRLCENKRAVEVLVRLGLFPALIALTHTPDRSVRERCVLTMSIMADADIYIRKAMVDQGALPALMEMAGSHDPRIRQNSVAALCELTSCKDVKQQMVDQGSVKALVLTGLIRASEDDPETCNSCCKALYNLLSTNDRFEIIIQDGVVWALTAMLGLTKEMRELGVMGLCNIASHAAGREEMSNANTLKALVNLATTKNPMIRPSNEIRAMCAVALHNLATGSAKDYRKTNSQAAIKVSTENGEEEAPQQSSKSKKDPRVHLDIMAQYGAIEAISYLSHLTSAESKEVCTAALAEFACNPETQEQFILDGGLRSLVTLSLEEADIVGTKVNWAMKRNCAVAANSISTNVSLRKRAIRDGAMELLHSVLSENVLQFEIRELCIRSIERYARDPLNLRSMVSHGAIEAIATAVGIDYDKVMKEQGFGKVAGRSNQATFLFEDPKEQANTMALLCVRSICRLSCGIGAPTIDLVEFGAVNILRAMSEIYYRNMSDDNRATATIQTLRHDIAAAIGSLSYSGDLRRIVREGAVACMVECAKSNNHETQELVAISFHNLASNASNHSMMVSEGAVEALIGLGRRSRTTTTMHFVATALCSITMDNAVREQMAKRKCAKPLSTLYTLLNTMSTDEVTPRYVALTISNLSRVKRAQIEIVQILDIVPLINQASRVSDEERMMLEIPERVAQGSKFQEIKFNNSSKSYVPPNVSSRMRGLEWSTHDFDPHRTTPKQPGLPGVELTKRRKIKTNKKKDTKTKIAEKGSPEKGGGAKKLSTSSLKEETNRSGRVNRYSKEVYADGPCIVTNETLEMLVRTMFKRSYLTQEELSIEIEDSERGAKTIVDLELGGSEDDDDDDVESGTSSERSFHFQEEEGEKKAASVEGKSEFLDDEPTHETQDECESQEEYGTAADPGAEVSTEASTEEPSVPLRAHTLVARPVSKPLSQGSFRASTPASSNASSQLGYRRTAMTPTVRVATAAVSAIRMAEMEKERRKNTAKKFVALMRTQADQRKAKQDAQLRKSLLEHTYKWAIAERDRTTMAHSGTWNGTVVGDRDTTSRQNQDAIARAALLNTRADTVPRFMAEGLERLIRTASRSSSMGRPMTQEGMQMMAGMGDGAGNSPIPNIPISPMRSAGHRGLHNSKSMPGIRSKKTTTSRRRKVKKKRRYSNTKKLTALRSPPQVEGIVDLSSDWP